MVLILGLKFLVNLFDVICMYVCTLVIRMYLYIQNRAETDI